MKNKYYIKTNWKCKTIKIRGVKQDWNMKIYVIPCVWSGFACFYSIFNENKLKNWKTLIRRANHTIDLLFSLLLDSCQWQGRSDRSSRIFNTLHKQIFEHARLYLMSCSILLLSPSLPKLPNHPYAPVSAILITVENLHGTDTHGTYSSSNCANTSLKITSKNVQHVSHV